jgi:hypothetical protein
MEENKFAAILPIVVGGLVNKIVDETKAKDDEVFEKLYNSKLYGFLEDEETKFWTYSVPKLFDLYQMEINRGEFEIPYF